MSAIFFSTSLSIGITESPLSADLARANNRYWKIFPLQLLAIGFVAVVVVRNMPLVEGSSTARRRLVADFAFICVFVLLLIVDYVVGIVAFDSLGRRVLQYLERT
jgi:hypothetical protein